MSTAQTGRRTGTVDSKPGRSTGPASAGPYSTNPFALSGGTGA